MARYEIPTQAERPVLFRLLKQASSYTLWAFIQPYFDDWVAFAKRIQPLAMEPEGGPSLNDSSMKLFMTSHAAFLSALAKLHKGDRSVFKWLGYGTGQGYLCEAWRLVEVWQTKRGRIQEGMELVATDYWPEFEQKFDQLVNVWLCNGEQALQPRYLDVPAVFQGMEYYHATEYFPDGDPIFNSLMKRTDIPVVPVPKKEVLIKTGKEIPCYGIWEPVKVLRKTSILDTFKRPEPWTESDFEIEGCMNYLHAGSPAPTIAFEGDHYRGEGRPTTWRLLWEDDRYFDGTIPEEEKEYEFLIIPPKPLPLPKPKEPPKDELLWAFSGDPAVKAGPWAIQELLHIRIECKVGDVLPQHQGQNRVWVWCGR